MGLCPKCGTPFEQNFGAVDCSNPKCRARIIVSISGDIRLAESEPVSTPTPHTASPSIAPSPRASNSASSTSAAKGISTIPSASAGVMRSNTSSEAVPMMVVRSHQGARAEDPVVPVGSPLATQEPTAPMVNLDAGPIESSNAESSFPQTLDDPEADPSGVPMGQDFEPTSEAAFGQNQEVEFQQAPFETSPLPQLEAIEDPGGNFQFSTPVPEGDNSWTDQDPGAAGSFVSPSDLDVSVKPGEMVNFDEVIEFAGNELPSAQFTYEVRIERIDTNDIRSKVHAVISDPLLGLMTGESRPEIKNGIVVISGLPPAKATYLLKNLEEIPVALSWLQSPTELSEGSQADEVGGAA